MRRNDSLRSSSFPRGILNRRSVVRKDTKREQAGKTKRLEQLSVGELAQSPSIVAVDNFVNSVLDNWTFHFLKAVRMD